MKGFGVLALCALLLGCNQRPSEPFELQRVQFGVFYGPEIQELTEIPLEPGTTGKGMVIRLTFRSPPHPPRTVRWELERPRRPQPSTPPDAGVSPPARGDAGAGLPLDRLVQYGEVTTRPGETVLDIPLKFRPGDPLGDWAVRVTLDGQPILNRPFRVVRPKQKVVTDNY